MPPRLFLVDGYALIYRAFFAMISRPLRTTKGENTSAAWGVVNFLLRLREKYRPDYVAWVNDAGTSFREQRYPEYKSTHEKLDDSLQADFDRAVERIGALLEGFRIPLVAIRGYEADDVIATLAQAGAARGLQAVIVSGDKDFYQLIRPGVALLNPGRGGTLAEIFCRKISHFGFTLKWLATHCQRPARFIQVSVNRPRRSQGFPLSMPFS